MAAIHGPSGAGAHTESQASTLVMELNPEPCSLMLVYKVTEGKNPKAEMPQVLPRNSC